MDTPTSVVRSNPDDYRMEGPLCEPDICDHESCVEIVWLTEIVYTDEDPRVAWFERWKL